MNVEIYNASSTWPTSGGNNERTGLLAWDIPFPLEIAWTFSECSPILGGIIASKNAIVDNFLYIGRDKLYAFQYRSL